MPIIAHCLRIKHTTTNTIKQTNQRFNEKTVP